MKHNLIAYMQQQKIEKVAYEEILTISRCKQNTEWCLCYFYKVYYELIQKIKCTYVIVL